ncbi:MAG: hypothetical protein AAF628_01690 [Planctomycetota bacterium]
MPEKEAFLDSLPTRWSRLERLDSSSAGEAGETWEWFARAYEPFVRNLLRLLRCPDADDAAREFWTYLFERRDRLTAADRGRRFRPFLTGFVRNFARERLRGSRVDGAAPLVEEPADTAMGEHELHLWAHTVLQFSLDQVERTRARRGVALRLFYGIAAEPGERAKRHSIAELAEGLGLSASTVSPLLTEARGLLRVAIERHLRETVTTADDLADELGLLFRALQGSGGALAPGRGPGEAGV